LLSSTTILVLNKTHFQKDWSEAGHTIIITNDLIELCHAGEVEGYTPHSSFHDPYWLALNKWRQEKAEEKKASEK